MKKAFTLIELMIVMAIMAILLVISLQVFLSVKRDREVKNFAEQAKIVIMQARGEAVTNSSSVDSAVSGFTKVKVVFGTHKISTYWVKGGVDVKIYEMPEANGVNLETSNFDGSQNYFNFIAENSINKLGQTDNITGNPIIKASNSSSTYYIEINKYTGDVSVYK